MALTPQSDEAFLREVDDELRRDQFETFWRRYGRLVAIVVGAGLLAFAGFLWWRHAQEQKSGLAAEQYTAALYDMGRRKADKAVPQLDKLATSSIAAYRASAKMVLAAAALDKSDTKTALARYQDVIDDQSLPEAMRNAALVRRTTLEFDAIPPARVVERMKPLAVEGSPWFGSTGELLALAYMKLGKRELAGPLFAAIAKDVNAPQSLRSRALRLAGALGVDAVAQPTITTKE